MRCLSVPPFRTLEAKSPRPSAIRVVFVFALGVALATVSAQADEDAAAPTVVTNAAETVESPDATGALYQPLFGAESDEWQFGLLLYAFLPLESELTSKLPGLPPLPETSVSLDLSDALEVLNMTFSGRLEAHKGPVGFFLEGYYVTFALDNSALKVDFDQYFVDLGVSYKLPPLRFSETGRTALYTELAAGGRYVHFKQTISFKGAPPPPWAGSSRGASANYLEPFIGGRLTLPFAERWTGVVRGDVGGFGVGSDLTWTVIGGAAWRISSRWDLAFGYRVYSLDYEEGSGVNEFRMDAFQHGPYIGAGFRF